MSERAANDLVESELVGSIGKLLEERAWRMATAESCTGGWVAKCCTDRAGSSAWFDRGYVTYSYAAKIDMLNVDAQTLEQFGAVSEPVVMQMAQGALMAAGVQATVAVTGIAGPDGATPGKPVGTVWFAWCVPGLGTRSESKVFAGDRESVRFQSVLHALKGMHQQLILSGKPVV